MGHMGLYRVMLKANAFAARMGPSLHIPHDVRGPPPARAAVTTVKSHGKAPFFGVRDVEMPRCLLGVGESKITTTYTNMTTILTSLDPHRNRTGVHLISAQGSSHR